MAGMLPGVELARRRRVYHHHQYNDSNSRDHPSLLRDRLQPSSPSDLDEAALKARRRLEEKLGLGRLRSRSSKQKPNEGRSSNQPVRAKESQSLMGVTKLEKLWLPKLGRRNSEGDVCAVCLDGFQNQQQVMNLPCSHRYHSDCLIPWLTTHSHCPYCRTHVQS
ncbi:PREDICTED: E3 ubiquitin-protein ligase RING1-like [Nelumbo nucifera]|uniref:E3 ubiquitin-protein ligase RING1-like n=1 Tax=Nelumbo nucifera TaxID=4432 RepID=A0A1U8A4G0_NELNU|nr:PREDICTED: E3 ubiquitin-protein ligase RING1-like [Nelumbo nucifera]